MRIPYVVWAVFTVFAVGALAYGSATPYRSAGVLRFQREPATGGPAPVQDVGAPDERQHANFVARLMRGEGLPVLRPGSPTLYEDYQAHQPPLYYALAAAWCRVWGIDPAVPDGQALRLLSVAFGLTTLLGVWYGARWLGMTEDGAAASTALLALPMLISLHGAASNDPLLFALCTWCLALLALTKERGWCLRRAIAIGCLAGFALLTKTTAIALLPCIALSLWVSRSSLKASWAIVALLLPLLIVSPVWARNVSLYGDPFGLSAFQAAFVGSPSAGDFIAGIGAWSYWVNMVLWWTARSAVGIFGYMDLFLLEGSTMALSNAFYALALVVLALPFLGLGRAARDDRKLDWRIPALFLGIVSVLFIRFNSQYFQAQSRYLFPAVAPIAWFWGEGLARIVRRPGVAPWLAIAVTGSLAVLGWWTLVSAFPGRVR